MLFSQSFSYNIIIMHGINIALYPDAQSALQQRFVRDFARLLI